MAYAVPLNCIILTRRYYNPDSIEKIVKGEETCEFTPTWQFITKKNKKTVDWGEANSLWAIATNKLIGLSTLEVYLSQAVDNELKLLIDMGIKKAVPHIERIIKLLHKEGLEVPSMPGRTSLKEIGKNTGEITFLRDNEIAVSIREILRLAMYLNLRGIETSYKNDIVDLIWDIYQEDFQSFRQTIALNERKNWLIPPPAMNTGNNVTAEQRMNWGEAVGLWSIARDKLVKISLLSATPAHWAPGDRGVFAGRG